MALLMISKDFKAAVLSILDDLAFGHVVQTRANVRYCLCLLKGQNGWDAGSVLKGFMRQ